MNKNYEFKVGDIIRCVSTTYHDQKCKGKIGKIINIAFNWRYTIEFFEHINGHSALGKGKDGYCWNLEKKNIELQTSILKLFLKEKQNETQV